MNQIRDAATTTAGTTQTATAAADARLMFSLLEAADALRARLEEGLASVGLSLAKYGMLKVLVDEGQPLSLGELAERQSCVRSNVTQLMDRLEADGLVRRISDPDDRRSIRAALTPLGVIREGEGAAKLEAARASFIASLPASDRAPFERVLWALR